MCELHIILCDNNFLPPSKYYVKNTRKSIPSKIVLYTNAFYANM